MDLNPVPLLADYVGTTPPALTLLISILAGYVLAVFYNNYVYQFEDLRHYYFIITGLDIAFYNFGFSMIHNMVPILFMYVSMKALGHGVYHTIVTFIFNLSYLIVGYITTESEDYDITWTMPHCVLTLKMIALSFDMWDGQKYQMGLPLSVNSRKNALIRSPSFIELLGFVYFPACFLVGPIFSFQRYENFVLGRHPVRQESSTLVVEAKKRLALGIIYLIGFQMGVSVFSMKYMQSDEFYNHNIFYRHFYCGLWAHFALYKYIACWLLTEAACIRFGLSYNGPENDGKVIITKWDACTNIKLIRFETATKFQHYIDSFNCNTNYFAAEYVYKRLKFMGDRNLSQFFTLLFLALWHGTKSGYYMTFFNEFLIIYMEKEVEQILSRTQLYEYVWSSPFLKYPMYILLKAYTIVFMGWSLAPFDLKSFSKWWPVYTSLYFSGFLLFLPWGFVYKPLLIKAVRNLPKSVEKS